MERNLQILNGLFLYPPRSGLYSTGKPVSIATAAATINSTGDKTMIDTSEIQKSIIRLMKRL